MEFFSNTFGGRLLESFRFSDEDDYEYEIFSILINAHAEPASFWRENVIAVVIMLRFLARMS